MTPIRPQIFSETGRLRQVVIGIADHLGPAPSIEECYDPKSRESVINGIYPKEADLILEMNSFADVLKSYGVEVFRPDDIKGVNQVFARDISFVLEDLFIIPNIIEDRQKETDGVSFLRDMIDEERIIAHA